MFKLIAATLAVLYGVLLVFGDETRRPTEVARGASLEFGLVSAEALQTPSQPVLISSISDQEAIQVAIAKGDALRAERRAKASEPISIASQSVQEPEPKIENELSYWFVTGSRVNLRGGPSTSNSVVGQVTYGTEAEVLNDKDGWYQIRLADGSAAGWIFGKFLNAERPG